MIAKSFLFLVLFCLVIIAADRAYAVCPQFAVAMTALDKATPQPVGHGTTDLEGWISRVEACLSQNTGKDKGRCMGLVCESEAYRQQGLTAERQAAYQKANDDLARVGLSQANVECFHPRQQSAQ
ncbi:MAG: hypothetical protein AB7E85_02605 [Pseudobdellovibrionaceae bacterium]